MQSVNQDDSPWCWMVKPSGTQFRVGGWNRHSQDFYPICSCTDLRRAQLICEAVQEFNPLHDFLVKGAASQP